MSFFDKRSKCIDLNKRHKKLIYHSSKNPLMEIGDLTSSLQQLYPNIPLSVNDSVCKSCYSLLEEAVKAIPKESNSGSQSSSISTPIMSSEEIYEDNEIMVKELNQATSSLKLEMSPIKIPQNINIKMRETYAIRKRKQMNDAFDTQVAKKITKLYDINDEYNPNENSKCETCDEWFENIKTALTNCSSFPEKVRLLSVIPATFSKNYLLSILPNITMYMIDQARLLANNGNVYKEPEKYIGHRLSNEVISQVMNYYTEDDFDCSRQSANKKDTISITELGVKTKKVKRFLTRSMKEMYKLFREQNPEMDIGKSKFYELRPKWVIPHPPSDSCICVYCENLNLMLSALNNFIQNKNCNVSNLESKIMSSIFCSQDNKLCLLGECEKCPIGESIGLEMISLSEEDLYEEIIYGIWEKSDLLNKISTIEDFLTKLRENILIVSTHKQIKEIQRLFIKEAKVFAHKNQFRLVIHVDFAENWSVLLQNEIQSYHWSKNQISIFTAVCYFANDMTVSFVTVSDDTKHDSSHALMAMDLILRNLKERFKIQDFQEIITISDGAASQFKNRYQFYELTKSKENRKWLFSATGHGKGACDGIGGLVKHYATTHNLSKTNFDFIRNAQDFVTYVSKYTQAINIIFLDKTELDVFRQKKTLEWRKNAKKMSGIQKLHCWRTMQENIYAARTSEHEWQKIN